MAAEFSLTSNPVRVTTATKQALTQALDVSSYDQVNALLGLLALGSASTGVVIRILTGMQTETEDGWVELLAFSSLTAANSWDAKNATTGLLKYIRWEVVNLNGASSVTFVIGGMLRTNG